jgi:hypothetical protein
MALSRMAAAYAEKRSPTDLKCSTIHESNNFKATSANSGLTIEL